MRNNAVQVVLNTKDFLVLPETHAGGGNKDFFAGRDEEFVRHRTLLQEQVGLIRSTFKRSGKTAGFLKVTLRKDAWAKSHRPDGVLFPENKVACVGASALGELFYRVSESQLGRIVSDIGQAEDHTKWKEVKNGKTKPAPSSRRSEVGAIESIQMTHAAEKRDFTAEQAIAWFSRTGVGMFYMVEIFATEPTLFETSRAQLIRVSQRIQQALVAAGLVVETLPFEFRNEELASSTVFGLRLRQDPEASHGGIAEHQKLLRLLDSTDEIRRVLLPPLLTSARSIMRQEAAESECVKTPALHERVNGRSYPKIAVVDGGLSDLYKPWLLGRYDLLDPSHLSPEHGDFIAGLLVHGQALNGTVVCPDPDGCELYDLALFPNENDPKAFEQYYPNHIVDFLRELDIAVEEVKKQGVRVFNMSLNLLETVSDSSYGVVAGMLDAIADRHDVLFVLSAGNLESKNHRPLWPSDPKKAVTILAGRSATETLLQPAESARSLTIGALNPPSVEPSVAGAPACYTRRGPGLRVGVKPDLAHYGGAVPTAKKHSGLASLQADGTVTRSYGTSYATPLAAKAVGSLESQVAGGLSRESLIALTVHAAEVPAALQHRDLKSIARQFVGFGKPESALDALATTDNEITLVFADTLLLGRELKFPFSWPACLVSGGGTCKGRVKLSLAYRPALDHRFGAEFVRLNVDARLQQEAGTGFKGRLQQSSIPSTKEHNVEADLIDHGLKWWPIKTYEAQFPKGVGSSSNWQLVLKTLTRAGQRFPKEGIPFTVALTIGSPKETDPVFRDLRLYLGNRNVKIADIRTGSRLRTTS